MMKNDTADGGIIISKNTNKALLIMLFASLILALFPYVEAQPGPMSGIAVIPKSGICPNYYGPYEPNLMGQPGCENMMPPGTYNINWAHGPESNWDWQYWDQLDMKANTKYVLTYDSSGELSIDESEDSSLTGYTVICGKNNGPDELVFCLELIGNTNQAEHVDPIRILTGG
jgi:hypothetical protein